MKTLIIIYSTLISLCSAPAKLHDTQVQGQVIAEDYTAILSRNNVSNGISKLGCLGASKYYIKLTVVNSQKDTTYLYSEVNAYASIYSANELLNKEITYKAYKNSNLEEHHCAYLIPKGNNIYWLNEEVENIQIVTKEE